MRFFMGPHRSERSKDPRRLAREYYSVPHGEIRIWQKGKNGKVFMPPQPWRLTERLRANRAFKKMLAEPQVQKPQFNKGDIVIFSPDGFPFPLSSWVNRTYHSEGKESYEIARITEVVHNPPKFSEAQKNFLIGPSMRGNTKAPQMSWLFGVTDFRTAQNEQDKRHG